VGFFFKSFPASTGIGYLLFIDSFNRHTNFYITLPAAMEAGYLVLYKRFSVGALACVGDGYL
jgi:hypothetical protein